MADQYWTCEDDIENDLYEISDFCTKKLPTPASRPSELMLKLRGKKSIFEDSFDEEDDYESQCIPVRGYPIQKNLTKAPGGVPSFLNNQTSAQIREVSGFGYSNENIEHVLRGGTDGESENPYEMKNIKFRPTNNSPFKEIRLNGNKSGNNSDSDSAKFSDNKSGNSSDTGSTKSSTHKSGSNSDTASSNLSTSKLVNLNYQQRWNNNSLKYHHSNNDLDIHNKTKFPSLK